MHVRIEIEWGNDALGGDAVKAAQREVFAAVGNAVNHNLDEGAMSVQLPDCPYPIEARFRRVFTGPQADGPFTAGGN